MFPILASLPAIMNAAAKVSDLFKTAQQTKAAVTGTPSIAASPEELQDEIAGLPAEQQAAWAGIMAQKIDEYTAQNDRLRLEIGVIDPHIIDRIDSQSAAKIAILRMTTRPWAVRWMIYYILFPFALISIDLLQQILLAWLPLLGNLGVQEVHTFDYVFGVQHLPAIANPGMLDQFAALMADGAPKTVAGKLYENAVPWVVSIIISYMGLREIGKARGHDDTAITPGSTVARIGHTLAGRRGWLDKVKELFAK